MVVVDIDLTFGKEQEGNRGKGERVCEDRY